MTTIETINLVKTYSSIQAVNNVNINIQRGEIFGLVGINGAGKSTLLNMLTGIIRPTSGYYKILGKTGKDIDKNEIGYLIEEPVFYPNLTVYENLLVIVKLRHIDVRKIDSTLESLRLKKYKSVKAGNLSTGNKQKLGVAKAIIHSPDILILDEPMSGLDLHGIIELRDLIAELASQGVTIIFSSHNLEEVEHIADRIVIVHEGEIVQEISSEELNETGRVHLIINTVDNEKALIVLSNEGIQAEISENKLILAHQSSKENSLEISKLLFENGCIPIEMYFSRLRLEDYLIDLIQ